MRCRGGLKYPIAGLPAGARPSWPQRQASCRTPFSCFLSRRQDADECGLEAARSRRKSGAAAECDCRHRENMATVDPVAFFRDAPVFRFLERFPFDVTLMSASDCRHDENSNPTSGAVIPATETDRRRARLVARRACSTWNGGLCADMP